MLNPCVDIAFKKIFGVEENKDLLISLINSIVSDEDQVEDVTLLNPYNAKNFKNDKLSVLDIKAKSVTGTYFNIEIQITDEADYDKRALYYWAKLYSQQLQESQDYSTLQKTIGIHILNFLSIPNVKKYHNVFKIQELEDNHVYFEDLELHTIELKKFIPTTQKEKKPDSLEALLPYVKSALDVWVAFLTRNHLLKTDVLPGTLNDPSLKKAVHVLEVMNMTNDEREVYEDRLKWIRTEANALKKHGQDKFKEGEAVGLMKGKAEGEAIGIEKGIEKAKIEMAKKLIALDMSAETIATATGLSVEIIEDLKG